MEWNDLAGDKVCPQDIRKQQPCLGSLCMAWRWMDGQQYRENNIGYCGLAGEPTAADRRRMDEEIQRADWGDADDEPTEPNLTPVEVETLLDSGEPAP